MRGGGPSDDALCATVAELQHRIVRARWRWVRRRWRRCRDAVVQGITLPPRPLRGCHVHASTPPARSSRSVSSMNDSAVSALVAAALRVHHVAVDRGAHATAAAILGAGTGEELAGWGPPPGCTRSTSASPTRSSCPAWSSEGPRARGSPAALPRAASHGSGWTTRSTSASTTGWRPTRVVHSGLDVHRRGRRSAAAGRQRALSDPRRGHCWRGASTRLFFDETPQR